MESREKESQGSQYDEIQEERKQLPIYEFRTEIINLIKNNLVSKHMQINGNLQFCIITGETGSGKSTQIAQFIVEAMSKADFQQLGKAEIEAQLGVSLPHITEEEGKQDTKEDREKEGKVQDNKVKVVVTQPRRVAAIQMAKRVSDEKGTRLADQVGYAIRFEDKFDKEDTVIKYVTDGILVRECLLDYDLNAYSVVILDEAHERSLNTDILFALVKQAVIRRQGTLRLVITSATLRTEQISNYYFQCPLLSVSGRCYPVSILHQESPKDLRVDKSVEIAIRIHLNEPAGDILVFLTGFEECEQATKKCFSKLSEIAEKKQVPPMMIVPLYGAQTPEQQANAFLKTPEHCRKIIFATNIAETSLTVANIGYVIDTGFVKQKIYNPQTGMESLHVVPISKVQAIQRSGRAGRTREGKCVRLYTEKFYNEEMPNQTVPEIKRVNLTSTVLTLKNMGINDILNFDYLDRPEQEALELALKQLYYIKAINKYGELKNLGRELSLFPLEPTYGKALLASHYLGNEKDMISLVSVLSSENIWLNVSKHDERGQSRVTEIRKKFMDTCSDHLMVVRIFDEWDFQRYKDDWCQKNYIQNRAMKQSRNIFDQLKDYMHKVHWDRLDKKFKQFKREKINKDDIRQRSLLIRRALAEGFYMNTSRKIPDKKEGTYLTVNDGIMVRCDRSCVFQMYDQYPDWIIFTEISGGQNSSVAGMIKMGCEISLDWVKDYMPRLKDINVMQLCGIKQEPPKKDNKKRQRSDSQNDNDVDGEEQKTNVKDDKEEKLKALKERYLKRQKTK